MKVSYTKKAIAGIAALLLAATLSACESDEDPNGTNGGTDTTTLIPDTTLNDTNTTLGGTTTAP